jgi:hypothetical protein
MGKVRYKVTKEQLERTVESFVMESAEATKHVKGSTPNESKGKPTSSMNMKKKYSAEAKKHKMSMGAEQADDMGDGMKKAPESKSMKMKQAPEAKKHVKGSVSEARLRQIERIMETYDISEEELAEWEWGKKQLGKVKSAMKRTMGDEDALTRDLDVKARSYKSLTGKTLSEKERNMLLGKASLDDWCGSFRVTGEGPEGQLVYDDCGTKAGKGAKVTSINR